MPHSTVRCLRPHPMEAFGAPKAVPHGRMALTFSKERGHQMVSHQPCFNTRLCLPLSGWGETRRRRGQVWTCPGTPCSARWWPAAPVTQGPGARWTRPPQPALTTGCSGFGVPACRRRLARAPGGSYMLGEELHRGTRCPHPPFPTGASLPDSPTASAVFQEKADTIAELADRGWYHPSSSAG